MDLTVNGSTWFAKKAPEWTEKQLTMCTEGGQQGFCMDGAVGNAVCNGVPTYPSSCESPAVCCTPQPCAISNTTAGVCMPTTECASQSGHVTVGYCGASGIDGPTSCCTGIGVAMCDTVGLLACLLADGDATTCAVSFHCPPLPDYATFDSTVQSAPSSGIMAHGNITADNNEGQISAAKTTHTTGAAHSIAGLGLAVLACLAMRG